MRSVPYTWQLCPGEGRGPSPVIAGWNRRPLMRRREMGPCLRRGTSRSNQFHRNRGRFAAADAEAGDPARLAVTLERGDQRRDDARAARADRMAERGRAAMEIGRAHV